MDIVDIARAVTSHLRAAATGQSGQLASSVLAAVTILALSGLLAFLVVERVFAVSP